MSKIFLEFKLTRGVGKVLSSIPTSTHQYSSCSWAKSRGSNPTQVPVFESRECLTFFLSSSWTGALVRVSEFDIRQCLSIFELQLEQVTGFESRERLNFVPEFKTRQRQSCFIESPSDRVLVRQWVRYPTVCLSIFELQLEQVTGFKSRSSSWVRNLSVSFFFNRRQTECWLVPEFETR